MVDVVSRAKRSSMMSGIKSVDTKPEIIVRRHLHALGIRFRLRRNIEGVKPDVVVPKWRACIFVHGCFWHRHTNCKLASSPKSNIEFWNNKFLKNIERDRRNIETLMSEDWRIGVIWECSVRSKKFTEFDIISMLENQQYWEI